MKKLSLFFVLCLLLTACSAKESTNVIEVSSTESTSTSESKDNKNESEDEVFEVGGSLEVCGEHNFAYHSVPFVLIDYVGQDIFVEWENTFTSYDEYGRSQEDFTILAFIEHFNISRDTFESCVNEWVTDDLLDALGMKRDEYLEEYGYTDAQIDALYSGNQAKINEAFCGEMACYNPKDGKLYSIYWLSDHTAEEYENAGIYWDDVHRIIDTATEAGGAYAKLAEKAAPAVKEFDHSFETCRSYTPCTEHITSYHSVMLGLMVYVGQDNFDQWYETCTPRDEYGRVEEDFNIQAFIEHFQVPREDFEQIINDWATDSRIEAFGGDREAFLMENGYTDAQIDALYSGDQAKINEAFCGEMACYNPKDGKLYSIYWLSDHTAEEYENAGIYWDDVHRIIDTATEAGGAYAKLAEKAAPAVKEFDHSFETCGAYTPCMEHTLSFHSVDGILINYVDQNKFNQWYETCTSRDEYGRVDEDLSILSFIQEFDIPKEKFIELTQGSVTDSLLEALEISYDEYLEEYGYTDAQIDALYSGDQAKINEAFCGEMAYYNPEDGQLYSIYWLSDHTAEEYESAGVPEAEVERILGLAEEAGGGYARFAEEAGEAAAEYAAMN